MHGLSADAPAHEDEGQDGLDPVTENEIIEFQDEYDLTDDNAWVWNMLGTIVIIFFCN